MSLCTVKGCKNPHVARGWCTTHYGRWRRNLALDHNKKKFPDLCCMEGCSNKYFARGFCLMHYQRNRRYGDPSIVHPKNAPTKLTQTQVDAMRVIYDNHQGNQAGTAKTLAAKYDVSIGLVYKIVNRVRWNEGVKWRRKIIWEKC